MDEATGKHYWLNDDEVFYLFSMIVADNPKKKTTIAKKVRLSLQRKFLEHVERVE